MIKIFLLIVLTLLCMIDLQDDINRSELKEINSEVYHILIK